MRPAWGDRSRLEPDPGDVPPGRTGMSLVPGADAELEAQLAHLDEIERRHEETYREQVAQAAGDGLSGSEPALPEEAWPAAIGDPPAPDGRTLRGYALWLDRAYSVLAARASRNRDELQRLSSQWVHVSRDLGRFRAEEVAGVIEGRARVRERIAADETCLHVIRLVSAWLRTWEDAAEAEGATEVVGVPQRKRESTSGAAAVAAGRGGALDAELRGQSTSGVVGSAPADVELVGRLLDGVAADRAGDARRLLEVVLEAMSGIALDMEVVQRQAQRTPQDAAPLLRGLHERLAVLADDLRALPGAVVVSAEPGEPLHATLRRCADRYQPRLVCDLAWTGGEPVSEAARAAVPWIVQEFLAAAFAARATRAGVGMSTSADATVLRLSVPDRGVINGRDGEPGWLLRCRARAAVAGGSLTLSGGGAMEVEVHFPVVAP